MSNDTLHLPKHGTPTERTDDVRQDEDFGEVSDTPWKPATNLEAPEARPGMTQAWIRTSLRGEDDPVNLGRALQEGWRPRKADTVPAGYHPPKLSHGRFAGYIGVQGLILCEMSTERVKQREAHYAKRGKDQMRAVDEDIQRTNADARGGFQPITTERSTRVTKGSVPIVADDD